jgi:DNA-binding SARP family transcriptional activator
VCFSTLEALKRNGAFAMSTLHISLFGKFCARRDEQILEGFDARKVQELFCYLLLHRDHSLSREVLASVLWPETTTALSKKSLRQALWQLQSALGSQGALASDRILVVDPEWIQLNAQADLWLDVAALEYASNVTQNIPGAELDSQKALMLQQVVQLYQGPLLEGWYNDWCILERERLQTLYLAMLDKLMEYYEARRDYETGLLYGMRILYNDRARERTHRRLMRLHYLNGDRAAALRQFEQCAITLEEELGARPSKGTMALYKQILADRLVVPEQAPASAEISHELSELLQPGVLDRLLQLQVVLADLQNQLGQSIQVVEEALASNSHGAQIKPAD